MITYLKTPTVLLLFFAVLPGYAEDNKSFWELGLGATFISFPDYVGSDERNNWILPFPYVVYRSDRFDVNRSAASGKLFDSEKLKLKLSLSGSIPIKSNDNKARKGMPDLDPIGEIGPSLEYELYRMPADQGRFVVELPFRAAFAVTFEKFRQIGWDSSPSVQYRRNEYAEGDAWEMSASAGPLFGDQRYFRYFYGVDPKFATEQRPAFATNGGFGGWRFSVGASRRMGRLWYGGFINYINIAAAEFADSPLVKTDHYVFGGVAVAWIFTRSDSDNESK